MLLKEGSLKVALCMAVGLMLICSVQSHAVAKPLTIKLGWTTSDGPTDPYAITARQFAEALEKEAPGQFNVEFFPNRALGDEKVTYHESGQFQQGRSRMCPMKGRSYAPSLL